MKRHPSEVSRDARGVKLNIAARLAQARGSFGQRISDPDVQTLQLVAQLLESSDETGQDNR